MNLKRKKLWKKSYIPATIVAALNVVIFIFIAVYLLGINPDWTSGRAAMLYILPVVLGVFLLVVALYTRYYFLSNRFPAPEDPKDGADPDGKVKELEEKIRELEGKIKELGTGD